MVPNFKNETLFVSFTAIIPTRAIFFIYFLFLSDDGPMLETLDHPIRIGSTPTFLYFDLENTGDVRVQSTVFSSYFS